MSEKFPQYAETNDAEVPAVMERNKAGRGRSVGAQIVTGRADPWETRQPFMIECLDCGIEWYWGYEYRDPKMQASADKHNEEHHND